MSYVHNLYPRWTYFDIQLEHPDWNDLRVLDFGGNWGNVLRDQNSTINPSSYTCLDVSESAIQAGRRDFPEARWVHYDRWNFAYNRTGQKDLPIPDLGQFDLILAFSVFTHTSVEEMLETVPHLYEMLAPGGRLCLTLLEQPRMRWFLKQRQLLYPSLDLEGIMESTKDLPICYLVNDDEIYTDGLPEYPVKQQKMLISFYSVAKMIEWFSAYQVDIKPPVNNELQHAVIITKT